MKKKELYEIPLIEIVSVNVEQFIASSAGPDMTDDGEIQLNFLNDPLHENF